MQIQVRCNWKWVENLYLFLYLIFFSNFTSFFASYLEKNEEKPGPKHTIGLLNWIIFEVSNTSKIKRNGKKLSNVQS